VTVISKWLWLPCAPGLNPCELYMCVLEDKVYTNNPYANDDLKWHSECSVFRLPVELWHAMNSVFVICESCL
jgi:hypothetical protein